MRSGRLHTKAAWLCLALHLSLSVGVSGLVLCVGNEGHVAIESRFAEDCCDDASGAGDPLRIETRDDCGCTDASLLPPAAGVRLARGIVPPGATLLGANDAVRAVPARLCASFGRVVKAACASPPLRALRTIVLVV